MRPGLQKALLKGKLRKVLLFLLQNDFPFDQGNDDPNGNTILHWVCSYAPVNLVGEIVVKLQVKKQKEIINVRNKHGETPLDQVIKLGDRNKIALLIKLGASGINDLLSKTYDEDKFIKILGDLHNDGVGMLTSVELDGRNLLHLVVQYGSLKALDFALSFIHPSHIDCVSHTGLTPLMVAVNTRCPLKCQALLQKGADPHVTDQRGICARQLSADLGVSLIPKQRTLKEYIEAQEILNNAFSRFTIEEAITTLQEKGFTFEEPIDHLNNTLLHILVKNIPYLHLLKSGVLDNISLNTQNIWGETPLIIAAQRRRHSICKLLIERGADPLLQDRRGKTARDYRPEFFTTQPQEPQKTYLEQLCRLITEVPQFSRMNKNRKVDTIFEIFIGLIQKEQLHYNGLIRDEGFYLLDCPIGKRYTVNCFDLAYALGYLIKYFDIDAQTYVYNDYTSISFTEKTPQIHGEFICFDKEHHARTLDRYNYYGFDKHCVVASIGSYYDPTFCCFYDHANDVIAYDTTIQADLNLSKRKFAFNLKFLGALTTLFPVSEWEHLHKGPEISIRQLNGFSKLQILAQPNGKIIFNALEIHNSTFARLVKDWEQSEKVEAGITYGFSSKYKDRLDTLIETFNHPPIQPLAFRA